MGQFDTFKRRVVDTAQLLIEKDYFKGTAGNLSVRAEGHQAFAITLALIDAPIPALFDEQVRFLGRSVDVISYAPSGTTFLKRNVKSGLCNGHNAYILQNHGVLVLGPSAERAVHNLELLEKCALAYLLALCTGCKVTRIPLAIREIAFAKLRQDEKKFAKRGRHV